MKREPSKPAPSGTVETFGGPFHHFVSDFSQRRAGSKRASKKTKNEKGKRKKPESKPASTVGVETFGGAYHHFESVFQPKPATPKQDEKKDRGKGKGRKSA